MAYTASRHTLTHAHTPTHVGARTHIHAHTLSGPHTPSRSECEDPALVIVLLSFHCASAALDPMPKTFSTHTHKCTRGLLSRPHARTDRDANTHTHTHTHTDTHTHLADLSVRTRPLSLCSSPSIERVLHWSRYQRSSPHSPPRERGRCPSAQASLAPEHPMRKRTPP